MTMGMHESFAIMRAPNTYKPREVECIMSGLNLTTSEIILGLRASERGTFRYKGQGKLCDPTSLAP
nr:hypothetical protein Iba_chr03aCG5180 [Ipomoea batatas]GMD40105.1 hypothetical protein Iba_chr10aCG6170 [Ipomoea batatas]